MDAKIKTGNFSQDKRGHWYFNVSFESAEIGLHLRGGTAELGLDIGIKTLAALSDGSKVERPNLRAQFLEKMRKLEKTRKCARRKAAKSKRFEILP